MNINIKATNMSLTPAIQDYLEKKLEMLHKFIDFNADNVFAQVELGKTTQHHRTGDIFRAEINARLDGHDFRAVSEKDDLYAAIDEMKDELARVVKEGKQKWMTNMKKGAAKAKEAMHTDDASDESDEDLEIA